MAISDQTFIFLVLAAALILFVWGRWRYDLVALATLLAVVFRGLVPGDEAFAGFAHPAVVTVAVVLVLSKGLMNAGVVDAIARLLTHVGGGPTRQIAALTLLTAVCSGFMNNVGALGGVVIIGLLSRFLVPVRVDAKSEEGLFAIDEYMTELRVPAESKMAGKTLHDLEVSLGDEAKATVIALIRQERKVFAPSAYEVLQPDDLLLVEATPEDIKTLVSAELELAGSKDGEKGIWSRMTWKFGKRWSARTRRSSEAPPRRWICGSVFGSIFWRWHVPGGNCASSSVRSSLSWATFSCCREAPTRWPKQPQSSAACLWNSGNSRWERGRGFLLREGSFFAG
jgi:hypothetical protein